MAPTVYAVQGRVLHISLLIAFIALHLMFMTVCFGMTLSEFDLDNKLYIQKYINVSNKASWVNYFADIGLSVHMSQST